MMYATPFVCKIILYDPIVKHIDSQVQSVYEHGWLGFCDDVRTRMGDYKGIETHERALWRAIHDIAYDGTFLAYNDDIQALFESLGFPKGFDYWRFENCGKTGILELYSSLIAEASCSLVEAHMGEC